MNLALVYHSRANSFALDNDLKNAKISALQASEYVDRSKTMLDQLAVVDNDVRKYISQFKPVRLQCYRILGQVYAGLGDLESCEQEFRAATVTFPTDAGAWQMLKRALELQGKSEEVAQVMDKIKAIMASNQAWR
jgi:tetratricopeptide (TPR) repeat protein